MTCLTRRSRVAAGIDWTKRGTQIDKGFPFMRLGYPKMPFSGSDVRTNFSFSAIQLKILLLLEETHLKIDKKD